MPAKIGWRHAHTQTCTYTPMYTPTYTPTYTHTYIQWSYSVPGTYLLADMPLAIILSVMPNLLPSPLKAFLDTLVSTGPGATFTY